MVELPMDDSRDPGKQVIFPKDDLWVPVSVVNGNIHILPGVPRLCTFRLACFVRTLLSGVVEGLLQGLKPFIIGRLSDPEGKGIRRVMISTPMAESAVAPYLTQLAAKVESQGVKVGSYPRWGKQNNTVTLVGRDQGYLDSLVPEVVENVGGRRINVEGEDDDPNEKSS